MIRTGATMLQSLGEAPGEEAASASTWLAFSSSRHASAAARGWTEGAAEDEGGAGTTGAAGEAPSSGGRTGGRGR